MTFFQRLTVAVHTIGVFETLKSFQRNIAIYRIHCHVQPVRTLKGTTVGNEIFSRAHP